MTPIIRGTVAAVITRDGGEADPTARYFRRYVFGQSLSLIGTWVETVAQALLVLRLPTARHWSGPVSASVRS